MIKIRNQIEDAEAIIFNQSDKFKKTFKYKCQYFDTSMGVNNLAPEGQMTLW